MTIQQLEYIVALDKHRHFVNAAEACGVTQPTLSAMISKLEEELDIRIFDRSRHPIEPTAIGREVINQANIILHNVAQMEEMVVSQRKNIEGPLHLAVIPTISTYLLPEFLSLFTRQFPAVELTIDEMQTSIILEKLSSAQIDMGILATPIGDDSLITIPLYYERFAAYVSPTESYYKTPILSATDMPKEGLWVLKEGHCLRNQVFNICADTTRHSHLYSAGSIDTLIKIVDRNGGYTIIPELHIDHLSTEQKNNVRGIENPPATREISIVIRRDFIRERMLNAVADTIKKIIPATMLDERLKKFAIKL